jgi:hypothetical protein
VNVVLTGLIVCGVLVVAASVAAVRVRGRARRAYVAMALLAVLCGIGLFDDTIGAWRWVLLAAVAIVAVAAVLAACWPERFAMRGRDDR